MRAAALATTVAAIALALACGPSSTDESTDAGTDLETATDATTAGTGSDTMSSTDGTGEPDACAEVVCDGPYESCEDGACAITCGEWLTLETPQLVPPRVVLVLDSSRTMTDPAHFWDHDGDDGDDDGFVDDDPALMATPRTSRWHSVRAVVDELAVDIESSIELGAQRFPSSAATPPPGPGACPVADPPEVPVALDNAAALAVGLPPADASGFVGEDPISAAIVSSVGHLQDLPQDLNPGSYMVLVTDGSANCSSAAVDDPGLLVPDEAFVQTIAAAFEAGIPTFVLGLEIADEVGPSGENPHATLDAAALAGGIPADDPDAKFYNARTEDELRAGFDYFLGPGFDAYPLCSGIQLQDPVEPDFALLIRAGDLLFDAPLAPEADCATEAGYRFRDETRLWIELCGELCAAFEESGSLELNAGCPLRPEEVVKLSPAPPDTAPAHAGFFANSRSTPGTSSNSLIASARADGVGRHAGKLHNL